MRIPSSRSIVSDAPVHISASLSEHKLINMQSHKLA